MWDPPSEINLPRLGSCPTQHPYFYAVGHNTKSLLTTRGSTESAQLLSVQFNIPRSKKTMVATLTAARSASLQRKSLPFKSLQNYQSFRPPRMSCCTKERSPPQRSKAAKQVTFSPFLEVRDLFRSVQDLKNSWYATAEYANFDRERRHTVAALHHVGGNIHFLNPEQYTVYGLERHIEKQSCYERKMIAKVHCYNVLQQAKRGCNEEELRRVSEYYSKEVSKQAHLRGFADSTLDIWYF